MTQQPPRKAAFSPALGAPYTPQKLDPVEWAAPDTSNLGAPVQKASRIGAPLLALDKFFTRADLTLILGEVSARRTWLHEKKVDTHDTGLWHVYLELRAVEKKLEAAISAFDANGVA